MKHTLVAMMIFIIGCILILISFVPNGIKEATEILQGIGGGLISGIVVLFISGIKSVEYRQLKEMYSAIDDYNMKIFSIMKRIESVLKNSHATKSIKELENFYADLDDYSIDKLDFDCYEKKLHIKITNLLKIILESNQYEEQLAELSTELEKLYCASSKKEIECLKKMNIIENSIL